MSNFLAHDMTPVDTADMYGPRRTRTSASMPEQRAADMPWKPKRAPVRPETLALADRLPESSLVMNDATGRPRPRDDIFTHTTYHGAARSEPLVSKRFPVPSTADTTAPSTTAFVPVASAALFYGVNDTRSAPSSTSHGFQKLDLFDELSPSRRAYMQRARQELLAHEEQQRRERQSARFRSLDARRAPDGYVLEKEHNSATSAEESGGRIRHDISDADRKHRLAFSETPPPRHRHFLEPTHDVTQQDREYLSDLAQQAAEWRLQQDEEARADSATPTKSFGTILQESAVPPRARVPRDFTSYQSPTDAMQFHPDYQYLRDQAADYGSVLHEQMLARESGTDYPVSRHEVPLHSAPADLPDKPNDGGRVRGLYDSLTRQQTSIANQLGNQRGSNRVHQPPTQEQRDKRSLQAERHALLDSLRRERYELEQKLRDDDAHLTDMESRDSPLFTKLGRAPPKDGRISFMHPENNVDADVLQKRENDRLEYVRGLNEDSAAHAAARDRERESEGAAQQSAADPWRWNHDLVERRRINSEGSAAKERNNARRDYHADLDRMTAENVKIARASERERLHAEREHLAHSLDEKMRQRYAADKNKSTKLRSFTSEQKSANSYPAESIDPHFYSLAKEIVTASPAGDLARTRRDHVTTLLVQQ